MFLSFLMYISSVRDCVCICAKCATMFGSRCPHRNTVRSRRCCARCFALPPHLHIHARLIIPLPKMSSALYVNCFINWSSNNVRSMCVCATYWNVFAPVGCTRWAKHANHLVQTRLGPTMAAGERMLLQGQLVNTFEYNVLHVYTTTLAHGSPLAPAPLRFHCF